MGKQKVNRPSKSLVENNILIPKESRPLVVLPKDIKAQGIVYVGFPSQDQELNLFLEIGDGAFLRTNTVIYLGSRIGRNLHTGHNAIIREANTIGNDVVVGTNTYLGPNNRIGDNVKFHTGAFIEGVTIEDNVIVSPGVTFVNDPYPPCHECVREIAGAHVEKGAVIGSNATILAGVRIGAGSLVGAGSVVTKDVPPGVVLIGNPARILKKVTELEHSHHRP